jgi:hypothetical protein
MDFIESKKTYIINCITIQYLFFSVMGVFVARQSHTIMLYSAHIVYFHIARVFLYNTTVPCIYTDCPNAN